MNGSKGTAIVIVALLLTVCVGYLTTFEDHTTTRTTYDNYSDLDALLYANSERSTSYDTYNSVYNVTGWTGATIPTSSTANQYPITKAVTSYTEGSITYSLPSPYTTSTASYYNHILRGWNTNDSSVFLFNYNIQTATPTLNNNEGTDYTLHGGYSADYQNGSDHAKLTYYLNNTAIDYSNVFYWSNINEVLTPTDGLKLTTDNMLFDASVTMSVSSLSSISSDVTNKPDIKIMLSGTVYDSTYYMIYRLNTEQWTVYDSNDSVVATYSNVTVYHIGAESLSISTYTPVTTGPTYADPNGLVTLTQANINNVWSNYASNDTLVNAEVSFILQKPSTTNTSSLYRSTITFYDSNGIAYTVYLTNTAGQGYYITRSYDEKALIGEFDAVLITVNAVDKTLTARGIVSLTDANNYTAQDAPISFRMSTDLANITSIKITSFINAGKAHIVETKIFTDPKNILWNNFNLNLESYFPTVSDNMRVLLNGYVAQGDSLTINGNTYIVIDGKITVPVESTAGSIRYKALSIDGLAIDYTGGNTYLVFTNANNQTVDLGETTSYAIAGAGSWYFAANVYQIGSETVTTHDWVCSWSLEMNAAVLVFVALIGVGCGIGLYLRGDSFGVLDWAVVLLSGFIGLTLVVL